jgi:excisionase family DNA binding protein
MAGSKQMDPLAYIENAFLDRRAEREEKRARAAARAKPEIKGRFRKTKLSAPRPRMAGTSTRQVMDPKLKELIENLPRNLEFLAKFYDDEVTSRYYNHKFKESRYDLMRRLLDPELTLEEVSRLLGVCPATVRRYTNRGWLEHHRTKGKQRRFRLSAVAKHVEEHGRLPEG